MIAICRIRPLPHYRRDAFVIGLRRAGYALAENGVPRDARDLLIGWNRYGAFEREADAWEAAGGTVLVCENGYLGSDDQGRQRYAISAHGHNGSGWFPLGAEDRFAALGIEVKPWRVTGQHIVVRGQRGIGTALMRSPPRWHHEAAGLLARHAKRPIRLIEHPAIVRNVAPRPIEDALAGAWACVIWASSVGVAALVNGIPVICKAPHWICAAAAGRALEQIAAPPHDDGLRFAALRHMAHAQWAVDEIAAGEPFARFCTHLAMAA